MKSEGRPVVNMRSLDSGRNYLLFNYADPGRPVSPYTSMPVIGMLQEPEWFTRKVAATIRLQELALEKKIDRLKHGRPETTGVVTRVRTALRLA